MSGPGSDATASVIIPGAGAGRRLGARTPKQFLRLRTTPILVLTVGHFARHPAVGSIVVVVPSEHVGRACRLLEPLGRILPITVVPGGAERQDSVRLGLAAAPATADVLVVHDAVRPFITAPLISAVIETARAHGAAICALPVTETIKRVADGVVEATVDRNGLWSVQTPQAFRASLLLEAHARALRDGFRGTDEAGLVERLGQPVRVVPGLIDNVKITTLVDLRRARGPRAAAGRRVTPVARRRPARRLQAAPRAAVKARGVR